MSNKPRIVAIVGPTASGKTSLGITLAERFNAEIISADSRQIYRGMDIGTAKPTVEERRIVPHHLIDIKNPGEDYTVVDYKRDAIKIINEVIARGRVPFLVGGTGLYIRAVVENLDIPITTADPILRAEIEREIVRDGLEAVFRRLVSLDPEAAYVVDPKNPRRVVRALEVALATGRPFTAQQKKNDPLFNALVIGLNPAPDLLRERIDGRVDEMIRDGLVDEVAALIKKYGHAPAAFDAIGYREVIDHLDGTLTLEQAVALIKKNTWHYAKRQVTWFKKYGDVRWVNSAEEAAALVESFLK